ncbi:ABC transporter ATP-binding protein [Salipiger sp. 1_MG-2023]|uniref:energy-coupling factor ABC transporter ATP-binding protein n=1 Tax=Salipiger sp. 1_MG-2023 TaxID=3062665 RepID=UPI0026E234A0|nr:ABC transporter ATP-binding protein [Salipiger sp. 1_MG-2023]MDO6586732.1 ABC transporter ATP-binding protein [Salipiger sp. 1_MG-2023]
MLELSNVSVTLGETLALRDVSLRADERRIGIVGRNGSGKTTLARIIAGLQAPDTGSARIDGRDMARDRKAALRSVGILFQNPDHQIIFPTVSEEIAFGLTQLGQSKPDAAAQTAAILAQFGKAHWADAPTHGLSQGQKQLVCLMAVLAMRPRLILLDEPFSGLDIPTRMQLSRAFDQAEARLIQITHDPDSVRDYERIIWIDDGALRADGPPGAVLPGFEAQMRDWGGCDDLSDLAG